MNDAMSFLSVSIQKHLSISSSLAFSLLSQTLFVPQGGANAGAIQGIYLLADEVLGIIEREICERGSKKRKWKVRVINTYIS